MTTNISLIHENIFLIIREEYNNNNYVSLYKRRVYNYNKYFSYT